MKIRCIFFMQNNAKLNWLSRNSRHTHTQTMRERERERKLRFRVALCRAQSNQCQLKLKAVSCRSYLLQWDVNSNRSCTVFTHPHIIPLPSFVLFFSCFFGLVYKHIAYVSHSRQPGTAQQQKQKHQQQQEKYHIWSILRRLNVLLH